MSWAEVRKINNNFKKTLNEQARELAYVGSYLFTASTAFTPEKSGWYKIIVVSRGGAAFESSSKRRHGSSGGVAIATRYLESTKSYAISANPGYSFEEIVCTDAGDSSSSAVGKVGTASGGDYNYNGLSGGSKGADVGVVIPGLMKSIFGLYDGGSDYGLLQGESGCGILGYGGGQTSLINNTNATVSGKGGCVLIIPLELEE